MKVRYRFNDGRAEIEYEAQDMRAAFSWLGHAQEIFGTETCGKCRGAVRLIHRKTAEGYEFYEKWCVNPECRCQLQFGQRREDGRLFPRRRDRDGNWLPNNGWVEWEPKEKRTTENRTSAPPPIPAGMNSNSEEEISEDDVPF